MFDIVSGEFEIVLISIHLKPARQFASPAPLCEGKDPKLPISLKCSNKLLSRLCLQHCFFVSRKEEKRQNKNGGNWFSDNSTPNLQMFQMFGLVENKLMMRKLDPQYISWG